MEDNNLEINDLKDLFESINYKDVIYTQDKGNKEIFNLNFVKDKNLGSITLLGKKISDGGRDRKGELRIQIASDSMNHCADLLFNNNKAVIIGVYDYEGETILCSFPISKTYAKDTTSRQINISTIQQASQEIFAYELKTKETKAIAFKPQLLISFLRNPDILLNNMDVFTSPNWKTIKEPHNKIYFGAPGTGKSFKLESKANQIFENKYTSRVTFYSDFLYGNFIGAYKPFPEIINNQQTITYKFIPGILLTNIVNAISDSQHSYLVIIEEINRANAAAVFGDFFQLLDRDQHGNSRYPIATTIEIQKYLEQEFSTKSSQIKKFAKSLLGQKYQKLVIPGNLYIWATMNSADQGVLPLDTAFKRRWEFEYIGIDDAVDNTFDNYWVKVSKDKKILWNDLRTELNNILTLNNVPEDKLIGPYFIDKHILDTLDIEVITNAVISKVLMYIYEDAGKYLRQNIFLPGKASTYSSLCKNFKIDAQSVFKTPLNTSKIVSMQVNVIK